MATPAERLWEIMRQHAEERRKAEESADQRQRERARRFRRMRDHIAWLAREGVMIRCLPRPGEPSERPLPRPEEDDQGSREPWRYSIFNLQNEDGVGGNITIEATKKLSLEVSEPSVVPGAASESKTFQDDDKAFEWFLEVLASYAIPPAAKATEEGVP